MLDLSKVSHHPIMSSIVDILMNRTDQCDRGFFQAEVAYFLGKVASSMRAVIDTKDRGEIPVNIYTLALATSGYGKGLSVGVMETEILAGFRKRFMEDTFPVLADQNLWIIANNRAARQGTDQQEEYDKTVASYKTAGSYTFTFDSGTTPAVKQLRDKLLMSNCGALNLQIDEIGSNLFGSTEVLTTFLELYDVGVVKTKLTKNTTDNTRVEQIDGRTPANMMLFGTPAKLFDGAETEKLFLEFLETGYARRCIFGYGLDNKSNIGLTPEENYYAKINPVNRDSLNYWSNHFNTLADPSMFGWKMTVEDPVGIVLQTYKMECETLARSLPEHEEVKKAELSHRYSKALKLAGAYAFCDVSISIEMDHLLSAIKLVEEAGESFQKMLHREKAQVRLAKYIIGSDDELTQHDLGVNLPFYRGTVSFKNDLMNLACAWAYKNHGVIKKTFSNGVECFTGETIKPTDLDKCKVSYSQHWAYNYEKELVPFHELHRLTQAPGYHWSNHHFKNDHRSEENVIKGFNMIVIDVDEGISLGAVHELMKDYTYLTYTTKRHQTDGNGDRFRLILPINYYLELDNDEYKEFMKSVFDWLPFKTDESADKREKKWETFDGGVHHYNLEGSLLDALPFIPRTTPNEQYRNQTKELASLDNLERWFAQRIASGNRNNQMIKYALTLVDAGWTHLDVMNQVTAFNAKLSNALPQEEIESTIAITIAKKFAQAA